MNIAEILPFLMIFSLTLLKVAKLRILLSRPLFIGLEHVHLDTTPSTNEWLRAYLRQHPGVPEGLVVTAHHQTAGRGQREREWIAQPGQNLTTSILLKPTFLAAGALFYLNKAVALAVRDTLAAFLPDAQLKWPNDIYAQNRKLAGILIETSVSSRVQWVIVGIGINVRQLDFGPSAPFAASIASLSQQNPTVEGITHALCIHLEHRYLQLRAGQFTEIDAQYHQHLLGYQTEVSFEHEGKLLTGTCLGVDENGKILIALHDHTGVYQTGEINWLMSAV
jgi:BirA family biotin operon repressor/biotin-[acetyl-CoA-carboxylase] ligase